MSPSNILVTDRIGEQGLCILRQRLDVDVRLGLSPGELLDVIPQYHALAVRSETRVTADLLAAASNLVVVGRAGVGVDNIDVEAATERGIVVVNAPAAITIATAEHTLGMLLALARHIPFAHASLAAGKWERSKFVGLELRGKTLGIAGLGRIGGEVARRARAFDMRVIAFDPFVTEDRAQALGVALVTKQILLRESDFLTLHLPLTHQNRHFLDDAEFAEMKTDVRIVNVARGELISEQALVGALAREQVAGAALDVFEKEPLNSESPLLRAPNLVLTPHLGASAREAQERLSVDVAHQLVAALNGEPVPYAVNGPVVSVESFNVIAPFLPAGALAGSLATQLARGQLERIEIDFHGAVAEQDCNLLKAAIVRGYLAPISEEKVTLVNADRVAARRGVHIQENKDTQETMFRNLIRVHVHTNEGQTTVSTTLAEDGPRLVEVNGFWIDVPVSSGFMMLCENVDRPGMIGCVGSLLGAGGVNIGFMRVGRQHEGGRALMVLGLDSELDDSTVSKVAALEDVFSVRVVQPLP